MHSELALMQCSHGCVPLHLIFLLQYDSATSVSEQNRGWSIRRGLCTHLLHESHARVTRTLSPFRLRFLATCCGLAPFSGRDWLSEAIYFGSLVAVRNCGADLIVLARMCLGVAGDGMEIRSCPRSTSYAEDATVRFSGLWGRHEPCRVGRLLRHALWFYFLFRLSGLQPGKARVGNARNG